jgi:hypothetical protein
MKTLFMKITFLTILFVVSVSIPMTLLQAEEVDFSCMSHLVKGKTQVSEHYKEFDIVMENRCPGTVYWSMCIERMDPWTNKIQVGLNPSGKIEMHKKSKVNLQAKRLWDESQERHSFQEFYVSIGYALKPPATAQCVASGCESKKRSLRTIFRKNDKDWHKTKTALEARIATECPQSSWDGSTQEACEAKIREASQAKMDGFAQKEKDLKDKMWGVDRDLCQVYGGG